MPSARFTFAPRFSARHAIARFGGRRYRPEAGGAREDQDTDRGIACEFLAAIGPARAEAIVLARVRRGWFRSLDELGEVDGFGPGILAGLAQHVTFGDR